MYLMKEKVIAKYLFYNIGTFL